MMFQKKIKMLTFKQNFKQINIVLESNDVRNKEPSMLDITRRDRNMQAKELKGQWIYYSKESVNIEMEIGSSCRMDKMWTREVLK